MSLPRILIVDDEEGMRFFLSEALTREGYEYMTASSGEEALRMVDEFEFGVVILDYNMPGMNGIDTYKKIRERNSELVSILMTAFGTKDLALEAMNLGVFDYFLKPFEIDDMRVVIRRAAERWQLQAEIRELQQDLVERVSENHLLGESKAIQDINERIHKVADSNVSVLILGESGTGKELIAQALHHSSLRKEGPFVKVNCAAVPHDLLEAEFFGYEKGAFTGAHKRKRGKFEQADNGTLFLDEIGDMPASTQMKILRALQEREIERLGGETHIKVDTRMVAATNKDLQKEVEEGNFREDLFYRLNVVSIHVPALRERREDIPVLANHFLNIYREKFKKDIQRIDDSGMALLLKYRWPGNVRELENVIQRGIVLAYKNVIGQEELLDVYPALAGGPVEVNQESSLQGRLDLLISTAERRMIEEALIQENWKRQETADRLGISRKSLHNKMKKYGLMN